MRILYRQGLISAQSNFLQNGQTDTRYVDISVSPTPVTAAVASGNVDYLISEQRSVTNAWGPFTTSETAYLYWDMSPITGQITRGHTNLSPVTGSAPPNPQLNQMWWDSANNVMSAFNGTRWVPVLRVFAGTLQSGAILVPAPYASQVGLSAASDAGYVLTDAFGHAFKNAQGKFLTTDTPLSSTDTGSLVKLQGSQVIVQANESIPKFSLVYINGGRAALASGDPSLEGAKDPIAMVTVDAYQNDAITLVTGGQVVVNEQWNWEPAQRGLSVYCDATGQLTVTKPLSSKITKVGTIMTANSVLLNFGSSTDIPPGTGVSNIGVIAPVTRGGSEDFPIIGLTQASAISDGYMSASDFTRIPLVEAAILTKADLVHMHAMSHISGLDIALAGKADVLHEHEISQVTGLTAVLNAKTDIGHVHVKADISDLQPTLDQINVDIALKMGKIPATTDQFTGNFPIITAERELINSGYDSASFAPAAHIHSIDQVTALQDSLDSKSPVGHGHAIAEVAGLQAELNSKSPVGHGHAIAEVADLQNQLDSKAPVVHIHRLDTHLTDVVVLNPVEHDFLGFDHTVNEWVNKQVQLPDVADLENQLLNRSLVGHLHSIAEVSGLQLALENKSDINHVHDFIPHMHAIDEIELLTDALNGKAPTAHTHQIVDVDLLQDALNNKSEINHTHVIAEVEGLQLALESKADINHAHALADLTDINFSGGTQLNDVLTFVGTGWEARAAQGGGGGGTANARMFFAIEGNNLFDSPTEQWILYATDHMDGANFLVHDSYNGTFRITDPSPKNYKVTLHINATAVIPNNDTGQLDLAEWPVQESLYYMTSNINFYSGNVGFFGAASKRMPLRRDDMPGMQPQGIDYEHSFLLVAGVTDVANQAPLPEFYVSLRAAFADQGYGYSESTHTRFKVTLEIEQLPSGQV